MRTITIYTSQEVADALRGFGLPVVSTAESEEFVDGEVVISDRVHVQVGEGYLIVSKQTDEKAYSHYPERQTPAELVGDIRDALK